MCLLPRRLAAPDFCATHGPMRKPVVQIFGLGGTIAMAPKRDGSAGVMPALTAEDLTAAAPELNDIADIRTETLLQKGSANLTFDEVGKLCRAAEAASGCDGIVVTQGTDSMEESAFLAGLLYRGDRPLVFTGAMRSPTQPGADGRANLVAAALTALADSAPHVSVVMNDEIHHPFYVTKSHTSNVAAFQSPIRGPIGQLAENTVYLHPVQPSPSFDTPAAFAPVALLSAVLDDGGNLFDTILSAGYKGLVVEAFGAGHVSEIVAEKLSGIAGQIPVLLSSRVRAGAVFERTYGYPGAEIDLLNMGLVPTGRLSGRKARILLSLLLGLGVDDWRQDFTAVIKHV